ncbi:MAG: hypothetical protein KY453_06050 [Gemmatimonadetes bacterium]|nr:hypothetical protein [Gemmatimonadota bacterium]
MTIQRDSDNREIARRLRDELARVRTSEAQVEQALQAVRGARRRIEELALSLELEEDRVRTLVRQEMEAVEATGAAQEAPGRSGPAGLPWRSPPDGARRPPSSADTRRAPDPTVSAAGAAASTASTDPDGKALGERRRLALVAVAAAVTVVLVGWLAFQGLRDGVTAPPLLMSDDAPAEAEAPSARSGEESPTESADPGVDPSVPAVLARLPDAPAAQVQLYDSLFQARSPLFAPLLDSVAAESDARQVTDAVEAWRGDGDLGAKDRDVVQSALVQWILMREIDQRVDVDGELLRNPCRGTSCSALLNIWQMGSEAFGFPEMPDDAPTNTDALRTVEAMLVLERMQDLHVGEGAAASMGG